MMSAVQLYRIDINGYDWIIPVSEEQAGYYRLDETGSVALTSFTGKGELDCIAAWSAESIYDGIRSAPFSYVHSNLLRSDRKPAFYNTRVYEILCLR